MRKTILFILLAALTVGCAQRAFTPAERALIMDSDSLMYVTTIDVPADSAILRAISVDLTAQELASPELEVLLVDTACRWGAEFRPACRVIGLVRELGKVCGVRVLNGGVESELRAKIVIGADGAMSFTAKEAGLILTEAGATFPYHHDPEDSNIRIAPSLPPVEELEQAMEVFCVSLKLAALEKLLG